MMKSAIFTVFLAIVLGPLASLAQSPASPMPPAFTPGASVERTLRAYPLGVITRQAAFSHHGAPHRKVKLANGQEGWVYDVGGLPSMVPYVSPNGRKQTVKETQAVHAVRSYTLVFDSQGVVADVLYNENGPHNGLTALSLQSGKAGGQAEEHAHPGPMPDQNPSGGR